MNNFKFEIEHNYMLKIKEIRKNNESSVGNVYNITTENNEQYILKIYKDMVHVQNMVNIHNILNENKILVPKIIQTKLSNKSYFFIKNEIGVIYTFLEGIQLEKIVKNNEFNETLIKKIAKQIRKIHDITQNIALNLPTIKFANNTNRKSMLHFDLTKHNIFINNNTVGFIDFDDAKYGDCVLDIAIAISLLFISKKNGFEINKTTIFLNEYYGEDKTIRQKEEPLLKKYAIEWINYILNNNEFDSSLKNSFENKRNMWENEGDKINYNKYN